MRIFLCASENASYAFTSPPRQKKKIFNSIPKNYNYNYRQELHLYLAKIQEFGSVPQAAQNESLHSASILK